MNGRRRWDWIGLGAGLAVGLFDYFLFRSVGLEFSLGGRDASLEIGLYLAASFSPLGYFIGRLMMARAREREDALTIERQLRELEKSRRAALQNEKLAAIGRLAAGVAHEVRNPLGVIRASASMIQESFDPEEEPYRACEFIRDEIDRLNGLITALLDFARPAEIRRQSVSLEKVVDHALHLAAEPIEARGIDVERAVARAAPELMLDSNLMAQAVYDLVCNAVEAAPQGGRLRLSLDATDTEVWIEVADDGPGVDPDVAAEVFEPFVTTKASGTGLGLAMAARIVEGHGGVIELVAGHGLGEAGTGACFRIRLPQELNA